MAANDQIDQIVAQQAYDQLAQLRKDIKETASDIATASKKAREAFSDLGTTSTLKDLVDNSKKAAAANKETMAAVDDLGEKFKAVNTIMAAHNGHSKEYITNLKGLEQAEIAAARASTESARAVTESTKAKVLEAKAATENAKAATLEAKASTENARQKEIETRYTITLTKEKERAQALADKEAANLAKQQSAYYLLNKEYREAALLAKDLGARQEILNREVAAGNNVQVNNTELARLGPQLRIAQTNAMNLHTSLLKIDQAVGQSQRNVGNYNGAAMAMSQILREAPSFAYSFSTGLLGISNNIPILADEIAKLKLVNDGLRASGAETIPIWKTLIGAITSPIGIITTLTAVLTIFSARMTMAGNDTEKATDKLKEFRDTLKEINQLPIKEFAGTEVGRVTYEALINTITSKTASIEAQTKAYQDLKSLMPSITREFTMEEIANGKSAEMIRKKANYIIELTESLKENKSAYQAELIEYKKLEQLYLAGDPEPQNKTTDHIQEQKQLTEAYINMKNDLSIRRAEILRDQQALNEANPPDIKEKKEKKAPRDTTLKNEQDLTKELYDEYAKRLQLEAEAQKAIADNETKSLEERLTAYRNYAELSFEAQAEGLSAEMDNVDASLKAIEKIEAKSADKRTQQEKELLARKAVLLQQYNNISAEYDLLEQKHIESTAKAIVAIQQEEVGKRIASIKSLTDNVDIQEAAAQAKLVQSLRDGTIKYKEYTLEKKKIEDKYQKEKYTQLVAYLQLEIDALSKQGVDTRALQEKLNEAQKHLYDADAQAFIDAAKQKEEAAKQVKDKIQQAVTQSIDTTQSFVDAYYERQLAYQQQLLDGIEERKNAEIDAINGSMLSEDKKQSAIRALNAQTAQQEKQIAQETRRIKREQAIADRVASILRVVENTAVAITAAISIPIVGEVLAGIDAAIGAAQIAAILATPLPAYWKGTGDTPHPGGKALVGELRPETIIEPGKPAYNVYGPAVLDLKPGTHVLPRAIPESELLAASMGFMTPRLLQTVNAGSDFTRLEQVTNQGFQQLTETIRNKQETHFHWSNGELKKSFRNGSTWTHHITNKL